MQRSSVFKKTHCQNNRTHRQLPWWLRSSSVPSLKCPFFQKAVWTESQHGEEVTSRGLGLQALLGLTQRIRNVSLGITENT